MKVTITVRSTLAIAGHSDASSGADATTARDTEGAPIIPGSAIRGALRIEAERLARATNQMGPTCKPPRVTCGDISCVPCTLFGSARQPKQQGGEGRLRFSDARLVLDRDLFVDAGHPSGLGYALRDGVALNRKRRVQQGRTLRTSELPLAGGTWVFAGDIVIVGALENPEKAFLLAAARAVTAIGGEKSRGLGECAVEITDDSPRAQTASATHLNRTVRLRVELEAPVLLGGVRPATVQLDETRTLIPGSTIRGALAFSASEDQRATPEFQAAFCGPSRLRFRTERAEDHVQRPLHSSGFPREKAQKTQSPDRVVELHDVAHEPSRLFAPLAPLRGCPASSPE